MKTAKHIHHTELGPWYVSISLKKILQKYYLVFTLSGLGDDNDVLWVKRGRWNKKV